MYYLLNIFIFMASINAQIIFDFDKKSDLQAWRVVDDVVMGGRSSGTIGINRDGHGIFEGTISLENNGGFSSVRYRFQNTAVEEYTSIVLFIKGDGKRYQLRLKDDADKSYSYIAYFNTSGEWQEIEVPLSSMYPSFRGMKLNQPDFSHESIEEIAFLIGNKKPEQFRLLIDKIELQ